MPKRLSYESADCVAKQISDEITDDVRGKTVVIVDTAVLGDFANLRAVTLEFEAMEAEYIGLAGSADALQKRRAALTGPESMATALSISGVISGATSAIAPVSALVGAGLGLVSLFHQDVEFHGAEIKLDSLTFEIAVGARLKAQGASQVLIANLMLPTTKNNQDSLLSRILRVEQAKVRAWRTVAPMISELVRLDVQLDDATAARDQAQVDALTAQAAALRRDLQPVSDPLSQADQRLAELDKQWSQVDEKTGLSGLARLLRAEAIHDMKPVYLHCAVVASGGHHRIVRNLWRSLFSGDGLSFLGGAIVRWALLANDGSLTKGGMRVATKASSDL